MCLLEHAPEEKAEKCTPQEKELFCYPQDPWPLSQECLLALTDDFNPNTHPQNVAQGLGSWSMHINDAGYYYQCNNLQGFNYWSYQLYELETPRPPDDNTDDSDEDRRQLRGGKGKDAHASNLRLRVISTYFSRSFLTDCLYRAAGWRWWSRPGRRWRHDVPGAQHRALPAG